MNQKHVFWQALFVTVLIFGMGVFLGVILENWRIGEVNILAKQSEIDLFDVRLQSELYAKGGIECTSAVRENIAFANRIYEEAQVLDRYESASRLTDSIALERKKYDLLRVTLLLNSRAIRETCNTTYYDVVYLYTSDAENIVLQQKQNVFSRLLLEAKEVRGDDILLIPISVDGTVTSVSLLLDQYGLTVDDLPVVVINDGTMVKELENIEDFLRYFD